MPTREQALNNAFVRLADSLVADYDPVEVAQDLIETLAEVLPGTAAGVLVADHLDRLQVLAATSEEPRLLELLPAPAVEPGPSLTAFGEGRQVRLADLGAESSARWPGFAEHARARGWAAVYALPMRLRGERIGVLKLFCPARAGLSEADIAAA
uniref:GAF domain-containing protein n=1 Tax=Nocardia sp. XZ_19_385 TaxID=2769488 RepID=UPI00188F7163